MKYVFFLSGDYLDLAKQEVLSLFKINKSSLIGQALVIDIDEKDIENKSYRLALTKRIYRVLFQSTIVDLKKSIKEFDWSSVYKTSYCVRASNFKSNNDKTNENKSIIKNSKIKSSKHHDKITKFSEKSLGSLVWDRLKNPKINLEKPKTLFGFFFLDEEVYSSLLIKEIKEDFEQRKSHNRPFPHPGSMHPKISRALINLTGAEKDEVILDPFCGTGGMLIEAGLMGIGSIGYDISKNMIDGCKENLKKFNIKSKIKAQNALNIKDKFDYIVTDLPYGLNSNLYLESKKSLREKGNRINKKNSKKDPTKDIEKFYRSFLLKIKGKAKNAIIVFPNFVDYKKIIKGAKFRQDLGVSIYVHGSLTREIVRIS